MIENVVLRGLECPCCGSLQASVEASASALTARVVCRSCNYKGTKYKATCKDDIPLACEMAERSALTYIVEDSDSEDVDRDAFDAFSRKVAGGLSEIFTAVCNNTSCGKCPFYREKDAPSGYFEGLGLSCDKRSSSEILDMLKRGYGEEYEKFNPSF